MASDLFTSRLLAKAALFPTLLRWIVGQRLWAITALTWRAAFRFRLFWVLTFLLISSVVVLPILLRDDGTARGFIQIMLTYTLSVLTALLGFSTLWLACGTLAREIEECQMQIVTVKPVARWQIWLGKWLGLLLINASLLALAGASVYGLLQWRAHRLPPKEQEILRNEIFVARASVREPAPDIEAEIDHQLRKLPQLDSLSPRQLQETRELMGERIKAQFQEVPPDHKRRWTIDFGLRRHLLRDQPLFIRIKFHVAQTNSAGTYLGLWQVGPPDGDRSRSVPQSLPADSFQEIAIPPNLMDQNGVLTVEFINRNDRALIFPLEDGFEVLYREGGFALNFARGLGIILCWLALLAALGLASASFLSFPVAAFFSISLLVVGLSSGTLANVVQEGTIGGLDHETGTGSKGWIDLIALPLFKAILSVVKLVQDFEPVDALSTGRSITWGQLGLAFLQVVLFLGGLIAIAGMVLFTKRELATAQAQN